MRSPNFFPGTSAGMFDPAAGPAAGRRHQHPRFGRGPGGGMGRGPGGGMGRGPGGGPGRGMGRGMGRGGRGRAARGDVRIAILLLLETEPMHGYQVMQAIADRTGGRWTPSPGAIYPAISQLEDEGLVVSRPESGRKVVELTEAGQEYVSTGKGTWPDPFGGDESAEDRPDLRDLMMQLHAATRQVGFAGTPAQVEAAAQILADARRALYLLLADGPAPAAPPAPPQ